MKRVMMLCFLTVVVSAEVMAQIAVQKVDVKSKDAAKAATDPTVDQIIDKFENVIGGRAAYEKVTSRVISGSFEMPALGLSGKFGETFKAPNKYSMFMDISGYGKMIEVHDGKAAWEKDPTSGVREQSGVELAGTKIDSELHREIKLRKLFSKLELKGIEKVGEREAYVIVATPTEGSGEKWYFDVQSGLMLRRDIEREGPQGKMPFELYLEDYREIDGIKLPFVLKGVNPAMTMIMKYESVKHNDPVDDAIFVKP